MLRRHPHVFGDAEARKAGVTKGFWERIKDEERKEVSKPRASVLDDVPAALPALTRALKLQKRAARVGFDWPGISHVLDKVVEESRELAEARDHMSPERQAEEFGDLLFVMVNLGRHMGLDAEDSLRKANAKFSRRFKYIEEKLDVNGSNIHDADLEQMDAIWNEIRLLDKKGAS
jgi:ATP diphosphatase